MTFIRDHFDRLLMLTVTLVFLTAWLVYGLPELARLTELAFVGLTALVGGRRLQNHVENVETANLTEAEAVEGIREIK